MSTRHLRGKALSDKQRSSDRFCIYSAVVPPPGHPFQTDGTAQWYANRPRWDEGHSGRRRLRRHSRFSGDGSYDRQNILGEGAAAISWSWARGKVTMSAKFLHEVGLTADAWATGCSV